MQKSKEVNYFKELYVWQGVCGTFPVQFPVKYFKFQIIYT